MMGSIPVFRSKNYGLRAVSDAGRVMMDVAAERLGNGDCLAIFPEGTCNTEDPTRLQHVNSGIGHIVARAEKLGCSPALVSIGIKLRSGGRRRQGCECLCRNAGDRTSGQADGYRPNCAGRLAGGSGRGRRRVLGRACQFWLTNSGCQPKLTT